MCLGIVGGWVWLKGGIRIIVVEGEFREVRLRRVLGLELRNLDFILKRIRNY